MALVIGVLRPEVARGGGAGDAGHADADPELACELGHGGEAVLAVDGVEGVGPFRPIIEYIR
jgi:hypothetical protein